MKPPRYLYKYRSLSAVSKEYTKDIFVHNRVFFAKPSSLNDPFECIVPFKTNWKSSSTVEYLFQKLKQTQPTLTRESFDAFVTSAQSIEDGNISSRFDEALREDLKQLHTISQKAAQEYIDSTFGIFSLSALNDDVLMWSHYADNHRGICIEFDTEQDPSFFAKIQPVEYVSQFPTYEHVVPLLTHEKLREGTQVFLRKSQEWSYEREWRTFIKGNGHWPINPTAITAIIFGRSISGREKCEVLIWLGLRLNDIRLFQADTSEDKYTMQIKPISADSAFLDLLPGDGFPFV